jgi:hypothetical protein
MWPYSSITPISLRLCGERCTDVYQQANCTHKSNRQKKRVVLWMLSQKNLNGCCGSEAAKVALLERMAAFNQKAELNQSHIAVPFSSQSAIEE